MVIALINTNPCFQFLYLDVGIQHLCVCFKLKNWMAALKWIVQGWDVTLVVDHLVGELRQMDGQRDRTVSSSGIYWKIYKLLRKKISNLDGELPPQMEEFWLYPLTILELYSVRCKFFSSFFFFLSWKIVNSWYMIGKWEALDLCSEYTV